MEVKEEEEEEEDEEQGGQGRISSDRRERRTRESTCGHPTHLLTTSLLLSLFLCLSLSLGLSVSLSLLHHRLLRTAAPAPLSSFEEGAPRKWVTLLIQPAL